MHVLLAHQAPIPVFAYGGTERVVWDLGRALTQLGHRVTYLVSPGSECPFADIVPIDPTRRLESQIPDAVDIVHFQFKPEHPDDIGKPWLMTQHGNSAPGEALPLNTVFVSKNHAQRHGSDSHVLNGLDWNAYGPVDPLRQQSACHFLGKAAWRVKNVQGAIDVALQTPFVLNVLGGHRFNFKRGLRWTFSPRVHFHGMVGGEQKLGLLRGSKGLVFPVRWHEPFGLAVIESLYFGAPVFATPYGALPELVDAGSGVLATSAKDLAYALQHFVPDRAAIHERVRQSFNAQRMAQDYLEVYQRVLQGQALHRTAPSCPEAPKSLPWHP